jgi:hypothetical protein
MSKQPKALLLADALDDEFTQGRISNHTGRKSSAELRRLYNLVMDMQGEIYTLGMARSMEKTMAELSFNALEKQRDALLGALRNYVDGCSLSVDALAVARAAIAKAEEA